MKRDCACPQARHVHGTHLAYIRDKCRCDDCRRANTAAEKIRNRAKLYGRYDGLVDAEPVRAHIHMLAEHGIGLKTVSRHSGVGGGVLTKLLYGHPAPDGTRRPPSRRVTPRVRDRILSVQPGQVADGALVDATGTRRRLQALVAVGWTQSKLARALGMSPSNFGKVLRHARTRKTTSDAVEALYDQLWAKRPALVTGPDKIAYSRALSQAREHGWLPPLAWDDDEIADPHATPHMPANKREPSPCGTTSAYRRHLRHGEKPCAECSGAEARRGQDYRKKAA